jgi:hypothetical protein
MLENLGVRLHKFHFIFLGVQTCVGLTRILYEIFSIILDNNEYKHNEFVY